MKNGVTLVIALVTVFLAGGVWAEGMEGSTARNHEKDWFAKGQEALAFGKYDEAITCYEKVLSINPGFSDTHRFIGDVYMKKGMPDSAIESYRKALDSKAQTVPALVGLGSGYFQKKRYDEALTAYNRALAIQPDNASVRIGLGDLYFQMEDWGKALSHYRKGLALQPEHAGAQLNVGLILQKREEHDKAALHFYEAGVLFMKQGDRTSALTAYKHLQQTEDEKLVRQLHDALQPSMK